VIQFSVKKAIVCLFVGASLLPAACAQNDSSYSEPAVEPIVGMMSDSYGGDSPGGSVLVMQADQVLMTLGFGLADLEWEVPVGSDTSFRLGSISKPITAIAILQLVERGVLDLDAPISTYLNDLAPQLGRPTLRQLLSHTSGLPDHFSLPQIPSIMRNPITPTGILELMSEVEPVFEPGTRWSYSNFNYVVLGYLIEHIDAQGRDYGQYIEEEIFEPLGMTDSHYDRQSSVIPRRARGYDHDGVAVVNTITVETSLAYAAGAMMSSADDMALFTNALRENRLLGPDMQNEAWTPTQLNDGSATRYGLGFNITEFMGERVVWHSGAINGFQTAWLHMPDSDRSVAVLSNGFYLANTTTMARRILAYMADQPVPDFTVQPFVDADWPGLEARYALADGRTLQLHVQDGVRFNVDGDSWADLAYAGSDVFFWPDSLSHLRIQRDAGGEITGVTYLNGALNRSEGVRRSAEIEGAQISVQYDAAYVASLAGDWLMDSGDSFRVEFDGQNLSLQPPGQPERRLHASATGEYFVRDIPISMIFDANGASAEINMWGSIFVLTRHQDG
jgi:CubicO group peptidase (beta-lactamase class C family)